MNALKKDKLIWSAVPTLFYVAKPPTTVNHVQTDTQKTKRALLDTSLKTSKGEKG